MTHSKFPWTNHPHTPTAVFDGDGRRIIDQWVAPEGWLPIDYDVQKVGAPWDGKPVLVYCEQLDPYIFQAQWRAWTDSWAGGGEWVDVWNNDPIESESGNIFPSSWQPMPTPPSDAPTPTPLDPDTAAANAVMIAGLPGLIEALDGMVLVCGRTGDALEDFEEQAEVFLRETGFMRPGKDMPAGWHSEDNSGARRAKYSEWVQSKLAAGRAVLASIGRTL